MRQRRLRNLDDKYAKFADLICASPADLKGRWSEISGGRPIHIEIGCGKGKFISELAVREESCYFIAIEGNKSVMIRAMEKVRALGLDNVGFIGELAGDLSEWFEDGEVDAIYLNFSDPLPKNYWYKRRLTYRDRLKSYFKVLADDGTLTFKTDNSGLFEWSLREIEAADLKILDITRDLHADAEAAADNIETEYEAKYAGLGEKIKRVVVGRTDMADKSMAAYNGRTVPKEDKVFATVARAAARVAEKGQTAVYNATAGTLTDDDGKLIVLDSVMEVIKGLGAMDYAQYAPIAGPLEFKEAVLKAAFGSYEPKSYTRVVATPGGTGGVRNAVDNYSCPGDRVLTHSWCWANYRTIADELGRSLETFEMFDDDGKFNLEDFGYKVRKLIRNQEHLVIILNTPANNPTGYSLSMDDWQGVRKVLDAVDMDKKVALVLDTAYIDYAGEPDEVREFFKVVDNLRSNILPIVAYSASKTFTMYGFRAGAMICMAHSPETADEFESVCSYAARTTWSNSPRPAMTVVSKIMNDPYLLERTEKERAVYREMLLARGHAFEEAAREAGLEIVPFTAGFFVTVPCDDPDALAAKLEARDVFGVAVSGGLRVTVASLSEDKCKKLPKIIKECLKEC